MHATSLIRSLTAVMVGALSVQFVLGIYVNLFVTIPPVSGGTPGSMMSSMGAVMGPGSNLAFMAHMLLGMLLILLAVVSVVVVTQSGLGTTATALAGVGLAALLVAGYGGMSFVMFGQDDALSFTMALGFIFALTAYVALLAVSTLGRVASGRLRTS